jgi:hypothetical protein
VTLFWDGPTRLYRQWRRRIRPTLSLIPSSSSAEEEEQQPRQEVINYISLGRLDELKRRASRDQNLEDIATTTYETTQQLERINECKRREANRRGSKYQEGRRKYSRYNEGILLG